MGARHQLIRADAGTGKTYALSLRYLELLAAGVEPSRIVAATFTRKAAGEILERILLRLAEAVLDPERESILKRELGLEPPGGRLDRGGEPTVATMLEGLVRSLPAVQVSTLDAFFARIVQGFRSEMGFGDLQRVGAPTDPGFVPLRAAALLRQLESLGTEHGEDLQALTDLASRLYRGDAQRAVAGGVDLLVRELDAVYREQRSEHAWQGVPLRVSGTRLDEDTLLSLVEQIDRAAELIGHKSAVRLLRKFCAQLRDGRLQEAAASRIVRGWLTEGAALTLHKKALPALVHQALERVVPHVGEVLLSELNERTRATREVLEGFERQFQPLLRSRGAATFDQLVEQVALWFSGEARGSSAGEDAIARYQLAMALLYRLDARVEHLLLDEFQDTSRLQWRALLPLVEEILSWGDGSRTLFAVGDPKQAIYGWRGGCVELFDLLEQGVVGAAGEVGALRSSYRSAPRLVEVVNQIFEGLAGVPGLDEPRARARDLWLRNWGPHDSARPELCGGVRALTTGRWEGEFPDDDPLPTGEEESEPRDHIGDVARYVAQLQRAAADGTAIGVLTVTNRTAGRLRDALARCGVVASGEGGARYEDDPVLLQVFSALRLAERPGDRLSAFHLRGRVLDLLAADAGCAPPASLPDGRGAAIGPVEELARRWRSAWSDLGASRFLAGWRLALLGHVSPSTRRRLRQLVATARAFEEEGLRGAAQFVEYALEQSLDERNAGANVQVMTVHKAKGLEFDLVVLGELERPVGRLNNPQVEVLRDQPTAAPSNVYRATNRHVRAFSAELQTAHDQELGRRTADDLSLLYVALTRARRELHLLLQPVPEKGGSRQATSASILLHTLCSGRREGWRSAYAELFRSGEVLPVALDEESLRPQVTDGSTVDSRVRPLAARRSVSRSPEVLRQVRQSVPAADLRRDLQLRSARSALRGELFHAWLAGIEWLEPAAAGAGSPQSEMPAGTWPLGPKQRQAAIVRLRERPGPSELARWWQQFRDIMAQPRVRRLFERPAKRRGERVEVWRERAFVLLDGADSRQAAPAAASGLVRGTFDRVEVYWRGRQAVGARVIDFKTGHRPETASLDGQDPYRLQIERYRQALARMLHVLETHVQGELVWLDRGEVESV